MNIKKLLITGAAGVVLFGSLAVSAFAAKPAENNAGAQKVAWNLSGAVMPVPPYGSLDISGSDTASKLIFNQPNGKVTAMLTGDMKGLNPNTTYTVYLSNGYTEYADTGWDVTDVYTMDLVYSGSDYIYTLTLNQSGSTITGILNDPYLPGDLTVDNGTINGNTVSFSVDYPTNYQGTRSFTGTINASGVLSGSWNENGSENGSDLWSTTAGSAVKTYTGNTGWSGQLDGTLPFTFTTNGEGSGSWHYNFKNAVVGPISVWINDGGTLLISDPISF